MTIDFFLDLKESDTVAASSRRDREFVAIVMSTSTHPKVFDLLKAADPLFTQYPEYTRKCQSSSDRQPIPIAPELVSVLRDRLRTEVDKTGDQDYKDELAVQLRCLDEGIICRGVFYFHPLTWDCRTNWFPKFSEAYQNDQFLLLQTKVLVGQVCYLENCW